MTLDFHIFTVYKNYMMRVMQPKPRNMWTTFHFDTFFNIVVFIGVVGQELHGVVSQELPG